ncbi:hypothetical protein BDD12DRAFT_739548, partial [Trichophaea hybrida]
IVFVHGLRGNRIATWSTIKPTPESEPMEGDGSGFWLTTLFNLTTPRPPTEREHVIDVLWPRDLLPQKIKNIRVLTYGYDSQLAGFYKSVNKNGIYQHAENLLQALSRERLENPQLGSDSKLIFVCHSMGGIIVKDRMNLFLRICVVHIQVLRQSKEATRQAHLSSILNSTYGIVFLGCPHRGSDVAEWGLLVANMLKLAGMSPNEELIRTLGVDNQTLQMIDHAFSIILRENSLKIHSFREEKGMSGFRGISGKVVGDTSAILGDADEGREGINGNHSEMCKFASLQDDGFRKVTGVLLRYVQDISSQRQCMKT